MQLCNTSCSTAYNKRGLAAFAGVVLCFMLARRNGQWAGGYLTANVYVFLVSSLMLCFALVVVSSTTLHLALNLRMSKVR